MSADTAPVKWLSQPDGCSIVKQGGMASIARYPSPECASSEVVYLLFKKRLGADGKTVTEPIDRRAVPAGDEEGRRMAVAELKARAEL